MLNRPSPASAPRKRGGEQGGSEPTRREEERPFASWATSEWRDTTPMSFPTSTGEEFRRMERPGSTVNRSIRWRHASSLFGGDDGAQTKESWSLTSSQQRLFKSGGRLTRHARYFILQMADSHLTPTLLRQILARIERRIGSGPGSSGSACRPAVGTRSPRWPLGS